MVEAFESQLNESITFYKISENSYMSDLRVTSNDNELIENNHEADYNQALTLINQFTQKTEFYKLYIRDQKVYFCFENSDSEDNPTQYLACILNGKTEIEELFDSNEILYVEAFDKQQLVGGKYYI